MRLIALAGLAFAAFISARPAPAADCGGLAQMKIEAVNLLSAVEVPAGGGLPAYCRVLGYVRPAINFEVRLPLTDWNGKFYMAGCGGFCGRLDTERRGVFNSITYAGRRNYAVATMDSGHWGASTVDGGWVVGSGAANAVVGVAAVTETARVGKTLVAAYYARAPQHAYFNGCSTGGRMAAMEATRFPGDFDGIIMGAPALDTTGLVATFFAWMTEVNTGPGGTQILGSARLPLIRNAVRAACGGQQDLVADPRTCDFKPETLQCKAETGPDCLSAAEVGVLQKWYDGPHDALGVRLYPGGVPVGSEANWALWLTGLRGGPPVMPLFARDFLRYMAFEPDAGPTYNVTDFDFERDPPRLAPMAALFNAATWVPGNPGHVAGPDLGKFAARGGKMIIVHGWGDPLVTPYLTIEWYETMATAAGGMDQLRQSARLFMVPGMDHCGINRSKSGISDTGIDPLTALEQWVEHGAVPDSLLARSGDTVWQRPICAYPQTAKVAEGSDPTLAASWSCAVP